jgi:hypothetical protein
VAIDVTRCLWAPTMGFNALAGVKMGVQILQGILECALVQLLLWGLGSRAGFLACHYPSLQATRLTCERAGGWGGGGDASAHLLAQN